MSRAPVHTVLIDGFGDLAAASRRRPNTLLVDLRAGQGMARNGLVVKVQAGSRAVILALAGAQGGIVSNDDLYDLVYGDRRDGGPGSLGTYIRQARMAAQGLGLRLDNHPGRGHSLRAVLSVELAS